MALLPLQDAAALLAKASGSGSPQQQASNYRASSLLSSRKDSAWLIGSTRTLSRPSSASTPPPQACRALTLHASPAFQVLFGARDSPACEATLSLLLSAHGGARALFTEMVTCAVVHAHTSGPAPLCLPERSLQLGGPHSWTLTVQPLTARSASGCDFPALLVRHSFEDMSALMARAAEHGGMQHALSGNQLDCVMVLTQEGQLLHSVGNGSQQGRGCAGMMERDLGLPAATPDWLRRLFVAEPQMRDKMMSEVSAGREWRYAGVGL